MIIFKFVLFLMQLGTTPIYPQRPGQIECDVSINVFSINFAGFSGHTRLAFIIYSLDYDKGNTFILFF